MFEFGYYELSYFIIFIYDNVYIFKNFFYDVEIGEVYVENVILVKKDLQDFMKCFRCVYEYKGYDNKFCFFVCGEYGL